MKSKENKKLTSDDTLIQVFKSILEHSIAEDKIYLDFLNNKIKYLNETIQLLRNDEPMKLFKTSHKKWKTDLENLESELMQTYEKISETIQEQNDFLQGLKKA